MDDTPEHAAAGFLARGSLARGFLAHRGLIAVAALAAMGEAALLAAVAPAARALGPQVTAVPPLAIFHDLRWLYSVPRPWLDFSLLLAVLVLGRSALNAVLVRLAWPAGQAAPSLQAAFRAALGLTIFASLLMSPIVSLTFGVAILPFSWPFLATLPAMLLIAIPLSHGGVLSSWWHRLPPPATVGWLVADFTVLSAAAAAIGRLPLAVAIPVAGLAGVCNARAWYGLAASLAQPRAHHIPWPEWMTQRFPVVPVATVVTIALVIAVTRLAFLVNSPADAGSHIPAQVSAGGTQTGNGLADPATWLPRSHHRPVLEVFGFGSRCCSSRALVHTMAGTPVLQFSYQGVDAGGAPLPYGPEASNIPLPVLGDRIAAQVWRLHAETGKRVDVVAESEGTLGVDAMLARHPGVPIGSVVLLSPIVAPGQVSYPVGGGGGAGMIADQLHAVVWFVGGLSPFGTAGAQTLISSVNSVGAEFAAAAARHRPVRWLELVPLADAVTLPACSLPPNVLVVPGFHGRLLGDPYALRMVHAFLTGQPVPGSSRLRATAELVAAAATAWRMPQSATPSPPCRR